MTDCLTDWLCDLLKEWITLSAPSSSSPWSLVYHARYCFCVWFLFSYIPTYINAFYVLLSRQIQSFQPTGNSSAILSNSGDRVPAVELTIKSFVYKICQGQKIGCYKNGSQKYCGRVFECYKVQIFVWSQTSNKLQVHSRRILMVKQQHWFIEELHAGTLL